MPLKQIQVEPPLAAYIRSVSLRDSDLLRRLRAETAALPESSMQISAEQGQLMSVLVQALGARRAIEVGVFTGYSSLCVALALPPGGRLIACDLSERWTSIARRYWREAGVEDRIDLRLGPALETLDTLLDQGNAESFDLAFIDADKGNYRNYYERVLRLLRPGGAMLIDNVLWSGRVIDPAVQDEDTIAIRGLNEFIHRDERVMLSLLPLGDGVTFVLKR
jgi:caffeoyl-CoA O-methyltransferase